MSINEMDSKVKELRELRRMADELAVEMESITDSIKRHMDAEGVDTLNGTDWKVTYKAVTSSRTALKKALPDLTAQDLLTQESKQEFLANGNAAVSADALPGAWNPTRRFYGLTDASRASVQPLFNVWPTEAQAASSSEPYPRTSVPVWCRAPVRS